MWRTRRQFSWDATVKRVCIVLLWQCQSATFCFWKSWFVSLHLWWHSSLSPLSSCQGQGGGGRSISEISEVTVTKVAEPLESLVGFQSTSICRHTPVFSKVQKKAIKRTASACVSQFLSVLQAMVSSIWWFYTKTIMMVLDFSIFSAIQSGQSRKPLKNTLHLKGLCAAPRHKQPHTNKNNFHFLLTTTLQIFNQPTPCCLLDRLIYPLLFLPIHIHRGLTKAARSELGPNWIKAISQSSSTPIC